MEDTHYQLLRPIESIPRLTQRDLAREMGVSLGKGNYCVNALTEKGSIKARNFRKSELVSAYLLTPRGIEQKAVTTLPLHFLRRKVAEYESLKKRSPSFAAKWTNCRERFPLLPNSLFPTLFWSGTEVRYNKMSSQS